MSVRLRKWTNSEGKVLERWTIDVKVKAPGTGKVIRVRDFSPVNTRRGAEQYERQIRQQILDGTFGKEEEMPREPAPTLAGFADWFLKVSTNNNKPSSVSAKQQILANHLIPALGHLRLDEIQMARIEEFKAEMKGKATGREAPADV